MTMTNLLNKIIAGLKETFHLLLAFSLIVGLFYLRLLTRVSRDLWENMTHQQFLLTLFISGCILWNIYNSLKIVGYIETKEGSGFLYKLKKKIIAFQEYIGDTLINFYDFVWYISEHRSNFCFNEHYIQNRLLHPLIESFTTTANLRFYCRFLLTTKFLPRIIFLIIFFYEAIFLHHLHYTFFCIAFLLLMFLETFFIFILKHYYDTHHPGVTSFLSKERIPNADEFQYSFRPGAENDIPFGCKDLKEYFFKHYAVITDLCIFIDEYEHKKHSEYYAEYLMLFLQVVRLIIYIYILFYGIL